MLYKILGLFESLPLVLRLACESLVLREVGKQLRYEMVINEGQEDRLHRIVHDVLRLEYPLNQGHVPLGPVLLPL